jgi:hypothetical protein
MLMLILRIKKFYVNFRTIYLQSGGRRFTIRAAISSINLPIRIEQSDGIYRMDDFP